MYVYTNTRAGFGGREVAVVDASLVRAVRMSSSKMGKSKRGSGPQHEEKIERWAEARDDFEDLDAPPDVWQKYKVCMQSTVCDTLHCALFYYDSALIRWAEGAAIFYHQRGRWESLLGAQ